MGFGRDNDVHLTAAEYQLEEGFPCEVLPWAPEGVVRDSRKDTKQRNRPTFDPFCRPLPLSSCKSDPFVGSPTG